MQSLLTTFWLLFACRLPQQNFFSSKRNGKVVVDSKGFLLFVFQPTKKERFCGLFQRKTFLQPAINLGVLESNNHILKGLIIFSRLKYFHLWCTILICFWFAFLFLQYCSSTGVEETALGLFQTNAFLIVFIFSYLFAWNTYFWTTWCSPATFQKQQAQKSIGKKSADPRQAEQVQKNIGKIPT